MKCWSVALVHLGRQPSLSACTPSLHTYRPTEQRAEFSPGSAAVANIVVSAATFSPPFWASGASRNENGGRKESHFPSVAARNLDDKGHMRLDDNVVDRRGAMMTVAGVDCFWLWSEDRVLRKD
jgi:hypothetical protein